MRMGSAVLGLTGEQGREEEVGAGRDHDKLILPRSCGSQAEQQRWLLAVPGTGASPDQRYALQHGPYA